MRLVVQAMSVLWCAAAVAIATLFVLPGILCSLSFLLVMVALAMQGSLPAIGVLLSIGGLVTYFCYAAQAIAGTSVVVKPNAARRMVVRAARRPILHRSHELAAPRVTVMERPIARGRRRSRVEVMSYEADPLVHTP